MSAAGRLGRAEVRNDALRLPHKVLYAALALLALLVVGALVHQIRPLLNRPVTVVDVRGRFTHLNARQIVVASRVTSGNRLFDIDLDAVRERVEALPWVASAMVKRRWPDSLQISVTQRQPVARWGGTGFLDRRGRAFLPHADSVDTSRLAGLPKLSGQPGDEAEVLKAWHKLSQALAATPLTLAALSEGKRGNFSAVTTSGIRMQFGPGNPLRHLPVILNAVLPALGGKLASVGVIDLRYTNGFAVAGRKPASNKEKQS